MSRQVTTRRSQAACGQAALLKRGNLDGREGRLKQFGRVTW